ncbi:unnamed protein product [Dovyalis caffra]|uniref:Uncharacterized protein n=1 Tax=Dovyalis caffra TaxID=77055 RepID=A0AAV1SGJ2_9ROSI|nr:unnamed protein product [Dovyalis caffra]
MVRDAAERQQSQRPTSGRVGPPETRKTDPLGVFEAQRFEGPVEKINLVANRNKSQLAAVLLSLTPKKKKTETPSYLFLSLQKAQKLFKSLSLYLSPDGIGASNSQEKGITLTVDSIGGRACFLWKHEAPHKFMTKTYPAPFKRYKVYVLVYPSLDAKEKAADQDNNFADKYTFRTFSHYDALNNWENGKVPSKEKIVVPKVLQSNIGATRHLRGYVKVSNWLSRLGLIVDGQLWLSPSVQCPK